jgi:hypothetical protein
MSAFVTPPRLSSMPPPAPGTGLNASHQDAVRPSIGPADAEFYPASTDKSLRVVYLLWFFLGWFGAHQFYLGKVDRGIGYLVTFAWFTIGWWVDLFTLPAQLKRINFERRAGLR